jgi:hypothetical protein
VSPHERGRKASQVHEVLVAGLGMALVVLALSYLALLGDDIRASRMGVSVEELDVPPHEYAHRHEHRAPHCDHNCIKRIPTEGETWSKQ